MVFIMVTLNQTIKKMLEDAGCTLTGRNANTGSYYIHVTSPDGREIELRDANHWGHGNSQQRRNQRIEIPFAVINLTVGKRSRMKLATREIAAWLGWSSEEIWRRFP
jgi:hypothetical protein